MACPDCKKDFQTRSPTTKRCPPCSKTAHKKNQAAHYHANSQTYIDRARGWRLAHPEEFNACNRRYYGRNKQKCNDKTVRWRRANPDKVRGYDAVRNAIKRNGKDMARLDAKMAAMMVPEVVA